MAPDVCPMFHIRVHPLLGGAAHTIVSRKGYSRRTKRGIHKRGVHEKAKFPLFWGILYSSFKGKFPEIALVMDTPFVETLLVLPELHAQKNIWE